MLKKHIKWFMEHMQNDRLDSLSAHGAYFIIISFIPFIAFFLALLNQLDISSSLLMDEIYTIIPKTIFDALKTLLSENVHTPSILSISIVTFLWSASSGMVAIIKGFDTIYDVKETRNYIHLRLIAILYTIIFAVTLIVTAMTLVFGNTLYNLLLNRSPKFLVTFLLNFRSGFGFILLVFFFCLMYNVIPRQRAKFRNNLFGSVFSALGWVLFSFFFSMFVENFANYSVVYGSLATLIVLMLWLYSCMYIMFLGAEVAMWLEFSSIKEDLKIKFNKYFKRKKKKQDREEETPLPESSAASTNETKNKKNKNN